uniref:Prepilin-type N-terminal cleavage/methylation domain-containing protein n=1 Tax=uncultured Elusimicrobia bacterium TaxID=699876 RepID=A0A650EM40_9BACT|nr:hypothetical protein Elusimicrob2101_0920 [uncultured Elusimicrobia bacterium]
MKDFLVCAVSPASCRPPEPGSSLFNKRGFTLIELLVVILIIGVLAAVAVPQYQKAVWKSRAAQLFTLARSLGTAQEAFAMANGSYPAQFSDLDLDFNSLSSSGSDPCALSVSSSDARRFGRDFEVVVNNVTGSFMLSSVVFTDGPYKCTGFVFVNDKAKYSAAENKLYCWEGAHRFSPAGDFCEKMFGGTYDSMISTWRVYNLP